MDWSKGISNLSSCVLNGGLAIGSVIWGTVANVFGIQITLSVASLALAATIIAKKRFSRTLC